MYDADSTASNPSSRSIRAAEEKGSAGLLPDSSPAWSTSKEVPGSSRSSSPVLLTMRRQKVFEDFLRAYRLAGRPRPKA
ncbi:MAG: hypothetical protein MZV70_59185 [Desulfobacterales bacterium]|nr:hypothetical protein [Desulfobacterales bacterium]